jgi:hypothetical protein
MIKQHTKTGKNKIDHLHIVRSKGNHSGELPGCLDDEELEVQKH